MARFFRLVQAKWEASAMSGHGARIAGGRWNPPGWLAVYLAESRALDALEILVHAPREVLGLEWRNFTVEVPDECIETVPDSRLPQDWRSLPSSPSARRFGEQWLQEHRSLALRVPSAIIPEESTLILNPLHRDAAKIRVSTPIAFHFDPRI